MSEIAGGIFTSHVPGIGNAIAKGLQQDPYWKPFFDGFDTVHDWVKREKPDVAVVFYNDHGLNFFLDKMPTFAIGAAPEYRHEDEGWGIAFERPFAGHPDLSWHIIEEVVASEFDPVTCQSMLVDHAVAVPFELTWPGTDAFPVKLIPIAVNTVQHPLLQSRPRGGPGTGELAGRREDHGDGNRRPVAPARRRARGLHQQRL